MIASMILVYLSSNLWEGFSLEKLTFQGYKLLVEMAQDTNPNWRPGQAYFNILSDVRPDLAEKIRATSLDPFHQDSTLPRFITFVRENW